MLKRVFATAAAAALLCAVAPTAAVAAPLEVYGNLAAVDDVQMSLDGSKLAYIANDGETPHIIVQAVTGEPLVDMPMPGQKVRGVEWGSPEHLLIETTVTSHIQGVPSFRGEFMHVHSLNVRTGKVVVLMNRSNPVALNVVWWAQPVLYKGKPTAVVATWNADKFRTDLFRADLDSGVGSFHEEGADDVNYWTVRPDGSIAARVKYEEKFKSWNLQLPTGSGWKTVMESHAQDRPSMLGLGRDGASIAVWTGDENGDAQIVEVGLDGKVGEPFGAKKNLAGPLYDLEGRLVGVRWNEAFVEREYFDPKLADASAMVKKVFAGRQVSLTSWNADKTRFVVWVEGSGEPGAYYMLDTAAKKLSAVGRAYPKIPAAEVAEVRVIRYKAADGMELSGYLTLPAGKDPKNLPVVVLPHGGPQARDYAGFDWWAQGIASRGYAVFQPQFRGSSGFGRKYVEAGHGEFGRKMQSDVTEGLKAIAARGFVDPKRACVVGASYGGYVALAGVTLEKDVYRCAVSVAGVADLKRMLEQEKKDGGGDARNDATRYWNRFMGVENANDPKLAEISPIEHVSQGAAPVLLIHGKDDLVVPYVQSEVMQKALQKAGRPVEFVTLAAEDHWLSRAATRKQMLAATVAFLEKHNPAN